MFKNALLMATAILLSITTYAADTQREKENPTALDTYVYTPDENYAWEKVGERESKENTAHILRLTSQQWLTEKEVDQPIWKHNLAVVIPHKVTSDTALLFISGGSNADEPPNGVPAMFTKIAENNGAVVVVLTQIPNQKLTFTDEDKGRGEDALIAYTWDRYMKTGDEKWPLRLPMTKSVVRAMDAVQEFCASEAGGNVSVENFVVAGASKRGWTTWTTAIVDTRVTALIPIVIDMLNVIPSFEHHWAVYGFWAPAIDDYTEMGTMEWMQMPEYKALMKIVEPYEYRERLEIPKLLLCATGDQFFLPDSAQFYFDDLIGTKYLGYVPNVGHGMGGDTAKTLESFFAHVQSGKPWPELTWDVSKDNTITIKPNGEETHVSLWQATNPEARDFRVDVLGKAYTETELKANADGTYTGSVTTPEKGWTAYFVEVTYPGSGKYAMKVTSPVRVSPDETPFTYEAPANPPKGFIQNKK